MDRDAKQPIFKAFLSNQLLLSAAKEVI